KQTLTLTGDPSRNGHRSSRLSVLGIAHGRGYQFSPHSALGHCCVAGAGLRRCGLGRGLGGRLALDAGVSKTTKRRLARSQARMFPIQQLQGFITAACPFTANGQTEHWQSTGLGPPAREPAVCPSRASTTCSLTQVLAEGRMERRLTAILAADVAGYSQLMGTDEARTVRDLKAHQAVLLPMISEFGGRIIDTAGDGIPAEFASVVKAVECAVAIQKIMAHRNGLVDQARRMHFRIGVNIGDV